MFFMKITRTPQCYSKKQPPSKTRNTDFPHSIFAKIDTSFSAKAFSTTLTLICATALREALSTKQPLSVHAAGKLSQVYFNPSLGTQRLSY
jgi:hypothetical protein